MSEQNTGFRYTRSYNEWREKASKCGLLFRALSQYYENDLEENQYTYSVDGTVFDIPQFTSNMWTRPEVADYQISFDDGTPVSDEIDACVSEYVKPAIFAGNSEESQTELEPEPDDYIWNGTIYGCQNISLSSTEFCLSPMTYYTAATRFHRLQNELYRSLYAEGVSPTDTTPFPRAGIQGTSRDTIAPELDELLDTRRPLSVGAAAICFVNTGDEYKLLISRMSDAATSGAAGTLDTVPSGFFEPDKQDTADFLTRHVLREFNEEVLGRSENAESLRSGASSELLRLLDGHGATLETVLAHVNQVKGHLTISCALLIDDPDFYENYLSDGDDGGWEVDSIEFLRLSDAVETVTNTSIGEFKTNRVPAVIESLCYLRDHRDVSLPYTLDGHVSTTENSVSERQE